MLGQWLKGGPKVKKRGPLVTCPPMVMYAHILLPKQSLYTLTSLILNYNQFKMVIVACSSSGFNYF